MKVLLVNTSSRTGGAAVAASRLMTTLRKNGTPVKMLVLNKESDDNDIIQLQPAWKRKFTFLWERFIIWTTNYFRKKNLFSIDFGKAGFDITGLQEYKEADIIHLHWVNQGMLSMRNIQQIMESGKKVVWTMHDMWPFTGICHYPGTCENFKQCCGNCYYLVHTSKKDTSHLVWNIKNKIYNPSIKFVGCSQWIASEAQKSSLLHTNQIYSIPNPIDTNIFRPHNKEVSRQQFGLPADKFLLLFGAARIDDERKGFRYLLNALKQLAAKDPESISKVEIIMFGQIKSTFSLDIPYKINHIGYIQGNEQLVAAYNAANLFIIPSLEDNLPNTIMEALACGVPCAGFNIGGIPEMIDHRINGYIAEAGNIGDLAAGIEWIINNPQYSRLSENAVHKVLTSYSESIVATQYTQLYKNPF